MARRRRERMHLNADINVVSLIDVMMLLMVIFMITAPMMQGGVDVSLPKAQARPLDARTGMVVTVTRGGEISIDGARLSLAEFKATFKTLAERRGGQGVYLQADESVPYGTVVQLLAIMRTSGTSDVGLVAEPEDAGL